MKGVFLNCPACKKMLGKNAYLRPGSFLSIKCFHCGASIDIISEVGRLTIKVPRTKPEFTEEDDDGMIFLSI